MTRLAALLAFSLVAAAPGVRAAPVAGDLGMTIFLQRQARLSAVSYSDVRAAVEDGRRPASDLETARRSLKAAQSALYDQIESTQRSNTAVFGDLRKKNTRRLKDEAVLIRAEETELPRLNAADRPNAEARLALSRQVLEGYQANDARLSSLPAAPPRPRLPILPPRS